MSFFVSDNLKGMISESDLLETKDSTFIFNMTIDQFNFNINEYNLEKEILTIILEDDISFKNLLTALNSKKDVKVILFDQIIKSLNVSMLKLVNFKKDPNNYIEIEININSPTGGILND